MEGILTGVYGVFARHECRPRGGAGRLNVVPVEDDSIVGEGIQVRCRELIRSMESYVIPALQHNRKGNQIII